MPVVPSKTILFSCCKLVSMLLPISDTQQENQSVAAPRTGAIRKLPLSYQKALAPLGGYWTVRKYDRSHATKPPGSVHDFSCLDSTLGKRFGSFEYKLKIVKKKSLFRVVSH